MPRTFYGPLGENYSDYANAGHANLGRFPLGHILILPDNREYRFALNDGTVEVAGRLYQSVVGIAGTLNNAVDVARAAGATAISATTTGSTTYAVDSYAEGIVHVNDVTGEGYAYRIKRAMTAGAAHASAASAAVLTVNLEPGETVKVALDTSSEVSFTRNRYHQVLITAAPPTGGLAGVSPGVAAADRFYWSQVKGYAAVLASGTLKQGLPVMAGISTAGSVESLKRRLQVVSTGSVLTASTQYGANIVDQDGTTTGLAVVTSVSTVTLVDATGGIANNAPIVGQCIKANATGDEALIDLAIT